MLLSGRHLSGDYPKFLRRKASTVLKLSGESRHSRRFSLRVYRLSSQERGQLLLGGSKARRASSPGRKGSKELKESYGKLRRGVGRGSSEEPEEPQCHQARKWGSVAKENGFEVSMDDSVPKSPEEATTEDEEDDTVEQTIAEESQDTVVDQEIVNDGITKMKKTFSFSDGTEYKPPKVKRRVPGKFFFGKVKGMTPDKEKEPQKTVILDVGGERFVAMRSYLVKYPTTRLGRLMRASTIQGILALCDEFVPGDPPEYFFDKNPENFAGILELHRNAYFHISENGCALVLQKDLEYWAIDELILEPCCALKYFPKIEICQNEKDGDLEQQRKEMQLADDEDFGNDCLGQWRTWTWNTMEYPWTSNMARFCAFFSLSMVLVSTVTFIISTMDELEENEDGIVELPVILAIIGVIDHFTVCFFTIEYLVRLLCAPRKLKFMKAPMNMIDFLAIVPFYLSLLLEGLEDFEIIGKAGKIIRLVKVMRILRIYRLVRHFAGLQSLFYTLQQAYKELGLLFILVAVAILTFSSLVYFAEKGLDNDRREELGEGRKTLDLASIGLYGNHTWTFIESFWWGLMTLTTVGYDYNPETLLGKILGGCCALSGVFVLTLPIPIVVNSFATYYKNRMWRNEVNMRKRERTREKALELKQMQKMFLLKTMAEGKGETVAEQPDLDGSGGKAKSRVRQANSKLTRLL